MKKYFTDLKLEWSIVLGLLLFIQIYITIVPLLPVRLNPEIENLIVKLLKLLVFMNFGWITSYRLYSSLETSGPKLYYTLRAIHTAAFVIGGSLII